jgi:hypothetical protein
METGVGEIRVLEVHGEKERAGEVRVLQIGQFEIGGQTFLYDADGNRTEDESVAVRGEIVQLDAAGRVLARRPHSGLDWQVDPKSLEGGDGELATRQRHEES